MHDILLKTWFPNFQLTFTLLPPFSLMFRISQFLSMAKGLITVLANYTLLPFVMEGASSSHRFVLTVYVNCRWIISSDAGHRQSHHADDELLPTPIPHHPPPPHHVAITVTGSTFSPSHTGWAPPNSPSGNDASGLMITPYYVWVL